MKKRYMNVISISLMLILIFNITSVYGAGETGNTAPIAGLTADVMKNSKIDFNVYTDYSGQKLADLTTKLSTFKANAFSKGSDFQYSIVNDKTKVSTYKDSNYKIYYQNNGVEIIIKPDGTIWSKGTNDKGQLGLSTTTGYINKFTQIPGITNAWRIFGNGDSIFLIENDLSVWIWGSNFNPDNSTNSILTSPVKVNCLQGTTKICQCSAGSTSIKNGSFYGLRNGKIITWGFGIDTITNNAKYLQISELPFGNDNKDFAASDCIISLLKNDGRVYDPINKIYIPNMTNIECLSGTTATCVGLKKDGNVVAYTTQVQSYGDSFRYCGLGAYRLPNYLSNYGYEISGLNNIDAIYCSGWGYVTYKKFDGTIICPVADGSNNVYELRTMSQINNVCCGASDVIFNTSGNLYYISRSAGNPDAQLIDNIPLNTLTPYIYDFYGVSLPQPALREDATHCTLLLSDGTGSDYSKPYGDYYNFGTLNKSFMYYLSNNNVKLYADTPAVNITYKSSLSGQTVSIQDIFNNLESKLAVDSTGTDSLLKVDDVLNDVYENYVVSALTHLGTTNNRNANITVLTNFSGSKLSNLQQTISTQKSYLYTQGVNADIQVYNSSKLLEKQAYIADIKNRLTGDFYVDKNGILYQYNSTTAQYDNTGITDVRQIEEYQSTSSAMIVKKDGSVWVWGYNYNGLMGIGKDKNNTDIPMSNPEKVPLENVVKVSRGQYITMFLLANNDVYICGDNRECQIDANNYGAIYYTPVKLCSGASDIKAGTLNAYVLMGNNLYHWGRSNDPVYYDYTKGYYGPKYANQVCDGQTCTLNVIQDFPALCSPADQSYKLQTTVYYGGTPKTGYGYNWINAFTDVNNGTLLKNITCLSDTLYASSPVAVDTDGNVWNLSNNANNYLAASKASGLSDVVYIRRSPYGYTVVKKDGSVYKMSDFGKELVALPNLSFDRTVEYLDLTKLYNSNIKKGEENYCILVSDGTGTDFTKPFNTYYSFGTLNNEFKAFCLNNNVECKVITPAANYDYILKPPDIGVSSQDISLRQLVDATGGKLYSSGEIGKALTEITYNRVQFNVLTDYTGTKLSNLVGALNTTKSNLYSNGTDLNVSVVDGNSKINIGKSASKIYMDDYHGVFLDGGKVYSFGFNAHGELGIGSKDTNMHLTPVEAQGITNAKEVYLSLSQTYILTDTGDLYAWGFKIAALGYTDILTPTLVASNVKSFALGGHNGIILKNDNTVWTFGDDSYGQLGQGTQNYHMWKPVKVNNLPSIAKVYISSAGIFCFAVAADLKTTYAWGTNMHGELSLNDACVQTIYSTPQKTVLNFYNCTIKAYKDYSYVLCDGNLYTFGNDYNNVLGIGNNAQSRYESGSAVLYMDHPYWILGNVKDAASGDFGNFGAAIGNDGKLYTWGDNQYGQLGLSNTSNYNFPATNPYFGEGKMCGIAKSLSVGYRHMAVINSNNVLYNWGNNYNAQIIGGSGSYFSTPLLGDSNAYKSICNDSGTVYIKNDGTVLLYGEPLRNIENGNSVMYWGTQVNKSVFHDIYAVDQNKALSVLPKKYTDRYFIYISDAASTDFTKSFGDYYSFGNLSNALKNYLVNNNYSILSISAASFYDYILTPPDIDKQVQELTIRQLVNSSPGEGKLYGLGEYKKALQYIEDKYSFPETPKAGYIEINDTLLYNKIYDDYEKDCNAANEEYAERWRYIHDPDVFENNQGIIADSNVWTGLSTTKVIKKKFDKVGKYTISYQAQDNPTLDARFANYKMQSSGQDQLDVYVNRRPIAKFSYIKSGSTLAITNRSYDLDHYSHAAHGIVQNQFKYKATDDDTWTMGQPTTIQVDKTYIITLKVKDEDGFVSLPYTLMVGKDINNPPVAQFTLDVPYMNSVIKTVDSSYDPDSDPLVEHKWAIKYKDGAWKYFDTLPNSLVDAGFTEAGQYTFGLRVKDDPTARNTALTPLYSNWYYVSVNVNYDLQLTASTKRVTKVVSGIPTLISTSTFKAGNGVVVVANTLGGAYKVDAYLVINKNFTPALMKSDISLTTPPQNEMDWHTRHKRSEGYEVNTVIPIGTKNGTYKIVVTAYKKKPDGSDLTKTVELPIIVNDSIDIKSEIIMP